MRMRELVQLKEQGVWGSRRRVRSRGCAGKQRRGLWGGEGRSELAALRSLLETQVQETGPSHLGPWTEDLVVTIPPLTMKGGMSMWGDEASVAIPHPPQ